MVQDPGIAARTGETRAPAPVVRQPLPVEDKHPRPVIDDRKRRHIEEPNVLPDSAESFLQAYDIVPHPELLYNAALAYEKGAESAWASRYFCRYIQESSDSPGAQHARDHVSRLGGACGGP